jgi:hypothetical protein
MATINNMIGGVSQAGINRNNQQQMNELRNQRRNNEITLDEFKEKRESIRELHEDARATAVQAGLNNAANVSNLFTYMNGSSNNPSQGMWGEGTFDNSVFIESGAELSNLQTLNSARIGIENRARSLVGEIGRDRARGIDVSDRQEALANLTGNLDILNKNLNSSIQNALGDGSRRDANFVNVVDRLRSSLKDTDTATLGPADLAPATVDEIAPGVEMGEGGVPDATSQPSVATLAMEEQAEVTQAIASGESTQASFAPPPALGNTPAEQIAAASKEQEEGEMSVASQIASDAKAEHAQSVDIFADVSEPVEAADIAMEVPNPATEANVDPEMA